MLHAHTGLHGKPLQDLSRPMIRAIIDDNDLVGGSDLFKATPDRSVYVLCAIKDWDDD